MKTSTLPPPQAQWYVTDASGESLGRLSARIAFVIRGKHRESFSPHLPSEDHIVVVNAASIQMGKTARISRVYRRHRPGIGHMTRLSAEQLLVDSPPKLLLGSIRGMLPGNRLREGMMKRIHVYAGSDHPHGNHPFLPLPMV